MRKSLMIITFMAVALCLSTFACGPVEEETVKVKAGKGSTLWGICEHHYDTNEVRCFEEFVYEVRKENELLNGKVLQAGQEVVIRIKKRN